jgi:hypothetical protein
MLEVNSYECPGSVVLASAISAATRSVPASARAGWAGRRVRDDARRRVAATSVPAVLRVGIRMFTYFLFSGDIMPITVACGDRI